MAGSPTEEPRSHASPSTAEREGQSQVPAAHPHPRRDRLCHRRHGGHGDRGGSRPPGRRGGEEDVHVGLHLRFDLDFGVERQELIRRLQRGDGKQRDIHHIHHVHHLLLLLLLRRPDCQFLVGHRDVGGYLVMRDGADGVEPRLVTRSFRAIGTTATVVVQEPADSSAAERLLAAELSALDLACSRFRDDSELQSVHAEAGRAVVVSELLFTALSVACEAAQRTGGAVDPTVGNAMEALGYDADLDEVRSRPPVPPRALGRVAGYQHVQLDPRRRTVRIPRGVRLDLGATAKALAADRAAARIAACLEAGVLVSIGGDVAVAGPAPADGWPIGIARESSIPAEQVDQVVAITRGGLASSGTSVRTWRAAGRDVHHIVDPRTGDCVRPYWVLVSATGSSCVEANLVTTAAIVWRERALHELARLEQSARLVRFDGKVVSVNGWPPAVAA